MGASERAQSTADRLGVVALELTVTEHDDLTPWLRELHLEGDLGGFAPWPGQDLMVLVPPAAAAPRWRRYTVRRLDAAAGWLDLWVTTECDGPGAAWARGAAAGDRVEAVGPRGKIALRADVDSHVFVVDAAGLAAMCAMVESLDHGTVRTVCALPDTEGDGHEAVLPLTPEDLVPMHHVADAEDLEWLGQVVDVSTRGLTGEDTAAYVFGELSLTRRVGDQLGTLLGADHVAAKPYWRRDRANAEHGEPDRETSE